MKWKTSRTPVAELDGEDLPLVRKKVGIAAQFDQPASSALIQQHMDVIDRAHRNGLPIQFFGYHPVFPGHRVVRSFGSKTDWVLMNIMHDPSFTEMTAGFGRKTPGTFYAPDEVIASLKDTLNAGIDFDSVFIAHEVPKGSVPAEESVDLEALLPPPPPEARNRRDFRERSLVNYWNELLRLTKRTFGLAGKVAAGTVALAGAAPLAAAVPFAGLDPVLFGVNYDESTVVDGKPVGMFYYITHWHWK